MTTPEVTSLIGAKAGLLLLIAAIGAIAIRFHLSRERPDFDLADLLMAQNGKLSLSACVLVGSFAITSWVIVNLAFNSALSAEHFAAYLAAWVTPVVAKMIWGEKKPLDPPK